MLQPTFLELHVGRSVTVHEFQEHPRNKVFIAAISFSKTQTDIGPNSASKEGGGGHTYVSNSQTVLAFLSSGE